jgi:HlyD family secretion protein
MTTTQLALSGPRPAPFDVEVDVEPQLRPTAIAGVTVIVAFVVGFFGWSLFGRLDSAAISQGTVVVDSQRKTVQHLEGGILRELLVREGEAVKTGQPVALLDPTQADAQLGQITSQIVAVQARTARLRAEQEGALTLAFPPELLAQRNDPVVAETISAQTKLFQARWRAHESAEAVLQKRIDQLNEDISANDSQLTSATRRLALLEEERTNVAKLLEKGFERRPRLLELERAVADLKGRQGELRGMIARSRQAIGGAQLEIVNLGDTRLSEVARELQEARALEADLSDRIRAARDVRQRREVVSPQDGIVTDIRTVTPGGVIGAGQPLMDIVPTDDELIIETHIAPSDVESVRVGLPARVRLSSYNRSLAPTVEGTISYVAADMMTDQRTGTPYFMARLRLSRESLEKWPEARLYPGMPAEVMIVTGERRAIDYFISPLTERMRRAFHEK